MNNQTSPSRAEMEAMLPDYVFGQLTEFEKDNFEKALEQYPDLQAEMTDMKLVFKNLEKTRYRDVQSQRTRNLSVKVLQRLEQKNARRKKVSRGFSFGIPSLVAAATAVIMLLPQGSSFMEPDGGSSFSKEISSLISPSEAKGIIETAAGEGISASPVAYFSDYSLVSLDAELATITPSETEVIVAELSKELDASFKGIKENTTNSENFDDEELQELLQVIQNAEV
ncbi:MAG TPA: hypothetical protein VEC36_13015 [Patescibacteria group bacterium]|nr:hypothetical protein [Patescibacteria group bacterium]